MAVTDELRRLGHPREVAVCLPPPDRPGCTPGSCWILSQLHKPPSGWQFPDSVNAWLSRQTAALSSSRAPLKGRKIQSKLVCLPRHTSFPDVQSALRSVVSASASHHAPIRRRGTRWKAHGRHRWVNSPKLLDKCLAVLAIITVAWWCHGHNWAHISVAPREKGSAGSAGGGEVRLWRPCWSLK